MWPTGLSLLVPVGVSQLPHELGWEGGTIFLKGEGTTLPSPREVKLQPQSQFVPEPRPELQTINDESTVSIIWLH